jgi:hypothetical protein
LETVRSDLEKNAVEEDIIGSHIYSALVLVKFPQAPVNVAEARTLIEEMEKVIEGPDVKDPGVYRTSAADASRP